MPAGKTPVNLFRSKHTFIYYNAQLLHRTDQERESQFGKHQNRLNSLQQIQTRALPVTPNGGPYENQFSSRKKGSFITTRKTTTHTCTQEKQHSFLKCPTQLELGKSLKSPRSLSYLLTFLKQKGFCSSAQKQNWFVHPAKGMSPMKYTCEFKKSCHLIEEKHLLLSQTNVPTELQYETLTRLKTRLWAPASPIQGTEIVSKYCCLL